MLGADSVPGLVPGAGLAVLNWVMRVGFLVSPPLVGLIAEHAGMRWTVAPMVVGGALIVVLAGPLLGRNARGRDAACAADAATRSSADRPAAPSASAPSSSATKQPDCGGSQRRA